MPWTKNASMWALPFFLGTNQQIEASITKGRRAAQQSGDENRLVDTDLFLRWLG